METCSARFCVRRQFTSTHCKMARFFSSMACRAAGMRKALFTNGPGIGTPGVRRRGLYRSAVELWHARTPGTHAVTHRTEEARDDILVRRMAIGRRARRGTSHQVPPKPYAFMSDVPDTMLSKQQVHDGDRSHPIIRKLDALTPTLSYAGGEDDARKIEWPDATRRQEPRFLNDMSIVDSSLERKQNKAELDEDDWRERWLVGVVVSGRVSD